MIKKTYQKGVKIIVDMRDRIIIIVPVVIGLLILRNSERRSTSSILKVPTKSKIAPIINIVGDKYGMDMYTDCVLDLSVINCNKLITIASIIAINFWSEITKGYSLKFKYICKSVHIINSVTVNIVIKLN
ncbi:hypothetical protein ATM22_10065 [Staphylococcus epidermidis]|nr:hypothetical protein HMPREF9995_02955 [Staphylococcus epidermidis NIHLM095]EJD84460.1 hypothetical protein HMPREF9993_01702 [Staphylococcus epidermidis NIHLM087]EJD98106.1 hypothetical protein HMPREF9986_09599 [Staphylococcus epidermidis NIHLM040]EJE20387.1 hypothetical protein HMPREF9975_12710 [Staphylococcus epidermidis NIHLM001]KTF26274.1 hypothetical protein AT255_01175 [Staphylococcus epidermidis FS1]OHQ99675.1 hypothetical protein HMPREF2595_04750 [Staphylococcus sp. HMSC077D09]QNL85